VPMKKLSLVCAVVVALAFADSAGSMVGDTIFTIAPRHFARLAGTDVYCKNVQGGLVDVRSFLCGRFGSNGTRERGTDIVEITERGVAVGSPPKSPVFAQFPQIPGWYPVVVNAVVKGNVTSVKSGQYARVRSWTIYCQAFVDSGTHKPAFDCGAFARNYHVGGSYSAVLDEGGVTVYRWDASGRHSHSLWTHLNP
jgi:hypothetical protein